MKVYELISKLQEMPQDSEVYIETIRDLHSSIGSVTFDRGVIDIQYEKTGEKATDIDGDQYDVTETKEVEVESVLLKWKKLEEEYGDFGRPVG